MNPTLIAFLVGLIGDSPAATRQTAASLIPAELATLEELRSKFETTRNETVQAVQKVYDHARVRRATEAVPASRDAEDETVLAEPMPAPPPSNHPTA